MSVFCDLRIFQLDRCRAAKDRDGHFQALVFGVDVFDHAGEAVERTVGDFDLLADLVR